MYLYLVSIAGEIPLKSHVTRSRFVRRLIKNIEDTLLRKNVKEFKIWIDGARIFIKADCAIDNILTRIFGIHSIAKVIELEFDSLSDLADKVCEITRRYVKNRKFAVRVHRVGDHNFTSLDIAKIVGAKLKPYSSGVDLETPDVEIFIEIRNKKAYVFTEKLKGPKGLPIGVEGKALVLFSGGFDSPVAAWFTAKRGVKVDFLHFILTSPYSAYYAFKVAKHITEHWLYGYEPKFYIVDLSDIVSYIIENVRHDYSQVVLRAVMYIVASKIVKEKDYDTIVTGESIGQASSQTLKNLKVLEETLNLNTLIVRPLISLDKEEIIDYSRFIGTYNLSSIIKEYCVIARRHVVTKADPQILKSEIDKIPDDFFEKAVGSIKEYNILKTDPLKLLDTSEIEIDFIPEGAFIIDVRDYDEYRKWHIDKAVHISDITDTEKLKDKIVIVYCKSGSLSFIFAKKLREDGIKAFSLKGGILRIQELEKKGVCKVV